MRIFFIFFHSLIACFFILNSLTATTPNDKQETNNTLRILDLLPNLLVPLAVDPAIPGDFVARSTDKNLSLYGWIYWGPEDVLKAYFKNPESLNTPLLRVKLSGNVAQTGPNSFSDEESLKILEKQFPNGVVSHNTRWGDYPVRSIQVTVSKDVTVFTAWVGLNDPEAGWTLMFNLVYPEKAGHPNAEDRQLWDKFINKTTQLKDGEFFKAYGQDLQDGYTIVNSGGAKLKMLAEKRQSDGMLQVVVIPENSEVKFKYEDMMECAMGAKWKLGEPMVKVYGEFKVNNKEFNLTNNFVTSIFYKTVSEFSFKKDDENKLLIFQKKFNTD
jgi:hypothetical protein